MNASIIAIGDEILLGRVTDTNSEHIARTLDPLGIAVSQVTTVGDDATAIRSAIERAMDSSPLVITTGGLGPTKDDITKNVMLGIFGGTLRFDSKVYDNVCAIFARRGLDMNRLTRSQAMVPDSCRIIQNTFGTAPVMWFERADGHVLISLPGVPHEACSMMDGAVRDAIVAHFTSQRHYVHRTLQITGITESDLAERLAAWEESLPAEFHLAYLPDSPVIKLRLDGYGNDSDATADRLHSQLREMLGPLVFDDTDRCVAAVLIDTLRRRHLTVSTAESCTGGNIAASITAIPGSSDVFAGSIVSYSNEVKEKVLGVAGETLSAHGAVSAETVTEMLAGACRLTGTSCAMATSGIAGPGGATPGKPVGTVWIGVTVPGKQPIVKCHHFPAGRDRVIARATTTAMLMLIQALNNDADVR